MRFALACLFAFAAAPALAGPHDTECEATAAAFADLENGMSMAAVIAVVGCEGAILSSSDLGGITTMLVAWDGSGTFGANMNVMLQNDRLVMKSQFGLR